MLAACVAVAALLTAPAVADLPKCHRGFTGAFPEGGGPCNMDKVRSTLKKPGATARCQKGPYKWPLLFFAARNCDEEAMIEALLEGGAEVTDVGPGARGATALQSAALMGRVNSARALLKAGADPEVEDDFGRSAMERAKSQEMRELLQEALEKRSLSHCEMAGAAECASFVVALQGRILESKGELIKLGLDIRKKIGELPSTKKGSEDAAPFREQLFNEARVLMAVPNSNAAQEVFARTVAFTWRSRVLCTAEEKQRSLEQSYADFLCVVLPKMKADAAADLMNPLVEALDKHKFGSWDADSNGVLSEGEFQKGIEGIKQELSVNSDAFAGQARRLLGGVDSFCSSASDVRLSEVLEGRAAVAALGRRGSAAGLAAAGCAICVAVAAAVAAGWAARRRGRRALLVQECEVE